VEKFSINYWVIHTHTQIQKNSNSFFIENVKKKHGLEVSSLVINIEGAETIILSCKPDFPISVEKIIIEMHPKIYGFRKQLDIIDTISKEGFTLVSSLSNVYLFERKVNRKN